MLRHGQKKLTVIQQKPSLQILTTKLRNKKKKKENWDNIYRGDLPLPDDLLERNRWNRSKKNIKQAKQPNKSLKWEPLEDAADGKKKRWAGSAVDVVLLSPVKSSMLTSLKSLHHTNISENYVI